MAIIIAALTAVYIMSKPIVKGKLNSISSLWLLALCVIVISYLRSERALGALMDVIILTCGILLVFFCSTREKTYEQSIKIVTFFGVFFAVGVFVQILLPSLYSIYLQILPGDLAYAISQDSSGDYVRGFATNAGFTAGYICAGIIAVMSSINPFEKKKLRDIILIAFLLIALLYTGKRAHVLFFFLTTTLCYLLPSKGLEKVKRYWKIFIVVLFSVILFFLLRDVLSSIPFISRIIDTINGLIAGEDVTSVRSSLYAWAWKQFTENPLLGIGWGDFRATVVGNATLATRLETHNIYLQLLCETGIIGFLCIVIPFVVFWTAAKNAYCQCLADDSMRITAWRRILLFSFAYQTFFLLYGLTGNPLYDHNYQIIYMFACSIVIAYRLKARYKAKRIF